MITDEELEGIVRESLHSLYPATDQGVVSISPARRRPWFGSLAYGLAAALAVIAIGFGVAAATGAARDRGPATPQPNQSALRPSPSESDAPEPIGTWPAAAIGCMPHYPVASQFVGLSETAAIRLAHAQKIALIAVVQHGVCQPILTREPNLVWAVVQDGVVVAARYQGWAGPPK